MYNAYKRKDPATPIEGTPWGKLNDAVANKAKKDLKEEEDWITIVLGDDEIAPHKVRKGNGQRWLPQACQRQDNRSFRHSRPSGLSREQVC